MEGNRWVARPKFGLPAPSAGAVRLFCFTPAGAGPTVYTSNSWAKLPPSIELAPVLLPGRAQRFGEQPLKTVAAIAQQAFEGLRPALGERPYALYGHSLGSCVALEFARLIVAAGLPRPIHVFLAAKGAPLATNADPMASIPGDLDFVKAVQVKYQSEAMQMVIDNPDLMEMVIPMMRADFGAAESYVVTAAAQPLDIPVSAIGGSEDVYTEEHFTAWAQFVQPGAEAAVLLRARLWTACATDSVFAISTDRVLAWRHNASGSNPHVLRQRPPTRALRPTDQDIGVVASSYLRANYFSATCTDLSGVGV